ncbi:hydroxymethylbilane synthase [Chlamydia avium]|uniref:hydroxymethylbilane synthase n=1 Tax=Chlamydia avium 10DC88 TaxID=1229831 RepID=W8JL51_9CHLA|nr:hydroxymethylbilane synthase [Chlamydia avium]AHK63019.1 putative porphobilinogen deaminase [Chlamydia avium 10DC88]
MLSACYTDPFLSDFCLGRRPLRLASRKSALAKAQVHECVYLLRSWYPRLWIQDYTTDTQGDKDKNTPLHRVENSNFFTDAVDDLVIRGICHLGIHSAKDLPFPSTLPVVAITRSLDPADMLVYRKEYLKTPFPKYPKLGSSSLRRNEILKTLFPQGKILDIRGTIEERLHQLESGKYDAIIVAKAALIRLHLTLPHAEELPPPYHPLQGCLGITASKNIASWKKFLSYIHSPNQIFSSTF